MQPGFGYRAIRAVFRPRLTGLCHQPSAEKAADARSALLAVDGIRRGAGRSWPSPKQADAGHSHGPAGVANICPSRKGNPRRRSGESPVSSG